MITVEQRLKMLQPPTGHFDMVLDTDAYNEVDDQYAISYALRSGEKVTLKALYAAPFYNDKSSGPADGMERSYREILTLLRLAKSDVPTYRGSEAYLTDEKTPVISDAAQDLAQRAMEYSSEQPLYVAAIGAITNIASAILINPEIVDRIVVVWIGGHALDWPNNYEFNCYQDVAAVRAVFGSGCPLVMVPGMGVTSALTTTKQELTYYLKGKNELCDYLLNYTVRDTEKTAAGKAWSRPIWDLGSLAWLLSGGREHPLMFDRLISTPIPEYDHVWARDNSRCLCKYVYHICRDELFTDVFDHLAR